MKRRGLIKRTLDPKDKSTKIEYFNVMNKKALIYAKVECYNTIGRKGEKPTEVLSDTKFMVVSDFNLKRLKYDTLKVYSLREWERAL